MTLQNDGGKSNKKPINKQSGTLYWLRIAFVIEIRTIKTII